MCFGHNRMADRGSDTEGNLKEQSLLRTPILGLKVGKYDASGGMVAFWNRHTARNASFPTAC
jgi:hypothetical protein